MTPPFSTSLLPTAEGLVPITLYPGEGHMSRHVWVQAPDGAWEDHGLSVVTAAPDGTLQVCPFTHETPSVRYHDTPLYTDLRTLWTTSVH